MILNYDPSDCLTPEEEAEIDARYLEDQEHEWLQSWADDFYSDEWAATINHTALSASDVQGAVRLSDEVRAA